MKIFPDKRILNRFTRELIVRIWGEKGRTLLLCYGLRHHLRETGWLKSAERGMPVDQDGNPLPWYTYPMISFLNQRVKSDMVIFEYGAGNSTLWWAKRVSTVISYEHDIKWFHSFREQTPSNVEIVFCKFDDDYSRAILRYKNRFDIIVIDGIDRVNCAKNSLKALTDNGVIIWDNSDREKYQSGYSYLEHKGFKRLDFSGHGPNLRRSWCTSIFYRDINCLNI